MADNSFVFTPIIKALEPYPFASKPCFGVTGISPEDSKEFPALLGKIKFCEGVEAEVTVGKFTELFPRGRQFLVALDFTVQSSDLSFSKRFKTYGGARAFATNFLERPPVINLTDLYALKRGPLIEAEVLGFVNACMKGSVSGREFNQD